MNDLNVDYVTYAVAIPGLCQESAAGHKWLTKVFDPEMQPCTFLNDYIQILTYQRMRPSGSWKSEAICGSATVTRPVPIAVDAEMP